MTDFGDFIPKLGHRLEGPGIEMIVEAVKRRQSNFPDEPFEITMALILMNIGDRFTPIRCEGREWRGYKKDILPGEGDPTCPNGHPLIKERGLRLGWIMDSI